MDKDTARKTGLSARKSLPEEQRRRYDSSLLKQMIACAKDAELTGCYVSMKDEPDTHAFLRWCFENETPVCVPRVCGNTLTFHRIRSFSELNEGTFGVMEPSGAEELSISSIDLMFVPLSAFDEDHNRTGYGRGDYDSVLLPSMRKIGIAYPEQKVDHIDADPWDIPLDRILLPESH